MDSKLEFTVGPPGPLTITAPANRGVTLALADGTVVRIEAGESWTEGYLAVVHIAPDAATTDGRTG